MEKEKRFRKNPFKRGGTFNPRVIDTRKEKSKSDGGKNVCCIRKYFFRLHVRRRTVVFFFSDYIGCAYASFENRSATVGRAIRDEKSDFSSNRDTKNSSLFPDDLNDRERYVFRNDFRIFRTLKRTGRSGWWSFVIYYYCFRRFSSV